MVEAAYFRHGTTVATEYELFCEMGITFGHVYDQLLRVRDDLQVDEERESMLWPEGYVRYCDLRPAWHGAGCHSIMLRPGEQFDHLLEPCTLSLCSTWLPRWEQHCRWVNTDCFDIYKMIHQFYKHDDNWEWNHFGERRYIDVDAELVLERHDTRELRFDVLLDR